MKKNILSAIAVCAALFSCQKKEFVEIMPAYDELHAMTEVASGTRTVMDEFNNVLWSADDQIVAFMRTSLGLKYQLKDSYIGKTSGAFSKVASGSSDDLVSGMELDHIVAYYPYSESVMCSNTSGGYALNVVLPSEQTYAPDSFGNGFWPMAAVSEGNDITFKNICGGLKLQLKGTAKIKTIELKGNAGELLSGNASVTVYSDGTVPFIAMSSDASKSVILDCGDGVQLDEETATEFILTVPPVAFDNGFTVTVTDIQNGVDVLSTDKANPIRRSALLSMPVMDIETEPVYTPTDYCISATYEIFEDGKRMYVFGQRTFAGDTNPVVCVDYGDGVYGIDQFHTYEKSGEYNVIFYFDHPITEIADFAFMSIGPLKSITIPNTVETIGTCAFYGGSKYNDNILLECVEFEGGSRLTTIKAGAFACNPALKELRLPSSIENIEEKVFAFCPSLEFVYGAGEYYNIGSEYGGLLYKQVDRVCYIALIPSNVDCEDVNFGGLPNVLLNGAVTSCKKLRRVDIGVGGILEIGDYNFLDCDALEYVNMSATQKIGSDVFMNCKSLRDVSMPVVSQIGTNAICDNETLEYIDFGSPDLKTLNLVGNNNPKLRRIHIPSGVTSISSSFNNDPSIAVVSVSALTPPALSDSFDSIPQDAVIYVPSTSYNAYKSASGWNSFSDLLVPYDFEKGEICSAESHYIDEYGICHGLGVEIGGVVWAPVNCGYHATDYMYGKLYQWGRKYGQGYDGTFGSNNQGTYTDAEIPTITNGKVTLEFGQSKENEDAFYTNASLPYDWLSPSTKNLWNEGTEDDPVKTEYDPCPEGWRVPTYKELDVICSEQSSWITNADGLGGYSFSGNSLDSGETREVFFPAAGYRFGEKGTASGRGHVGYYWSSNPYPIVSNASTYAFYFNPMWAEKYMSTQARSNGCSVRCVQE